jgi:spermidine/putrescine ABC transporter ATP-binding subunit
VVDVTLDGVTKRFGGVAAVDGVSLTVKRGEFVCLLGPSGSGKTTLLRIIAGFEQPDEGRVLFGDRDSTHVHPSRRNIGMVFQHYALFPHMTVYDNVAFGLKVRSVSEPERRGRIMRMLELVKLPGLERRYPRELSGGQQQRAALARALVIDPDILLLDEPLGALDRKLRLEMQPELQNLQQRLGITTVFVTHDQGEALALSDRIAVLASGRIEQIGEPRDIYERPATPFVADFMGTTNAVRGVVASVEAGAVVVALDGGLSLRACPSPALVPGRAALVAVRPERILLAGSRLAAYENVLTARVERATYMGTFVQYTIGLAGMTWTVLSQNADASEQPFPAGFQVYAHVQAASVVAFPATGGIPAENASPP